VKSARAFFRAGFLCVLVTLSTVVPASFPANAAIERPVLSSADQAAVNRIEAYLNDLGTLKSRFLQASSRGNYAEGTFYLSRPGKMRIEYDPPIKFLIVADGTWLMYLDKELDQLTHLPLGSTPADILIEDNISFLTGDLVVTKIERTPGVLSVTLIRKDEDGGQLTLIFADKPLELKKWIVVDAQGVKTSVSLLSSERDVSIDPKLFNIKLRPSKQPLGEH
jgi:outer membrane lipoprotein-sorting protein